MSFARSRAQALRRGRRQGDVRRRRRHRRGGRRAARGRRVPARPARSTRRSAAASPRACCSSARPAPARRCSPARWPARRSVPFFSLSGSDFVEMFVGVGAARVRDLFQQAEAQGALHHLHRRARRARQGRGMQSPMGGHDEREQTLNQLLVEMDGFDSQQGRDRHGRHQPARDARPGPAAPRPLRPAGAGRPARRHGPRGDPADPREAGEAGRRRRPRADRRADGRLRRRRPRQPRQRGGAAGGAPRQAGRGSSDFDEAIDRVVAGLEKKRVDEPARAAHRRRTTRRATRSSATLLPDADPVHKVSIMPRGFGALGYTMQLPTRGPLPDDAAPSSRASSPSCSAAAPPS